MKNVIALGGALIVSTLTLSAGGTEYYVDSVMGDDAWDGQAESPQGDDRGPWRSLARVNEHARSPGFGDGDVIALKRGAVWTNDEPLGWDGGTVSWGDIDGLTIQDYGDAGDPKPWVDCTTQTAVYFVGWNRVSNLIIRNLDASGMGWPVGEGQPDSHIRVDDVENVTINGIIIDGHRGTTNFIPRQAISLGDITGDITVSNCEIYNIIGEGGALDCPEWSIVINMWLQEHREKTEGRIRIVDNVVHDVMGDILQPAGWRSVDGTTISGNLFYHFGENAIDLKSCSNIVVEDNEIYRDFGGSHKYRRAVDGWTDPADMWPNTIHDFASIVMHDRGNEAVPTQCENITIRNNHIHSTGDYRAITSGHTQNLRIEGNTFTNARTAEISGVNGGVIANNVWHLTNNPSCDPVHCARFQANGLRIGTWTRDVKVLNNTFFVSSETIDRPLQYDAYESQSNNVVQNNVVVIDSLDEAFVPFRLRIRDDSAPLPTIENNLYFATGHASRVTWDGHVYGEGDLTEWHANGHPGALFDDPLFIDPANGDMHLQPESPAIDTGLELSEVPEDHDGVARPQGSIWDLGAFEYCEGCVAADADSDSDIDADTDGDGDADADGDVDADADGDVEGAADADGDGDEGRGCSCKTASWGATHGGLGMLFLLLVVGARWCRRAR